MLLHLRLRQDTFALANIQEPLSSTMDDIFGGLEIADTAAADTTSAVDSSKAPATPSSDGKLTREQRLARAFQNSKDTWRPEHGLTESGVSAKHNLLSMTCC